MLLPAPSEGIRSEGSRLRRPASGGGHWAAKGRRGPPLRAPPRRLGARALATAAPEGGGVASGRARRERPRDAAAAPPRAPCGTRCRPGLVRRRPCRPPTLPFRVEARPNRTPCRPRLCCPRAQVSLRFTPFTWFAMFSAPGRRAGMARAHSWVCPSRDSSFYTSSSTRRSRSLLPARAPLAGLAPIRAQSGREEEASSVLAACVHRCVVPLRCAVPGRGGLPASVRLRLRRWSRATAPKQRASRPRFRGGSVDEVPPPCSSLRVR
jgi:hypothetical protein